MTGENASARMRSLSFLLLAALVVVSGHESRLQQHSQHRLRRVVQRLQEKGAESKEGKEGQDGKHMMQHAAPIGRSDPHLKRFYEDVSLLTGLTTQELLENDDIVVDSVTKFMAYGSVPGKNIAALEVENQATVGVGRCKFKNAQTAPWKCDFQFEMKRYNYDQYMSCYNCAIDWNLGCYDKCWDPAHIMQDIQKQMEQELALKKQALEFKKAQAKLEAEAAQAERDAKKEAEKAKAKDEQVADEVAKKNQEKDQVIEKVKANLDNLQKIPELATKIDALNAKVFGSAGGAPAAPAAPAPAAPVAPAPAAPAPVAL